jgi:predicted permease
MKETWRRLMSMVSRDHVEAGLDEEIRFHIDQQTEKNIRAGMTPTEARRRALVRFGGVESVKEQARDEFRPAMFEDFIRDLRYGARILWRVPGFAIVAILTLGLGIGAATAVFSVVNGVLLAPLPYPDADRIVRLFQIDANGRRNQTVSEPNFDDWKSGAHAFRAMALMSPGPAPITIGDETSMIAGAAVSREFFDVMRVAPAVGRTFRDDELRVGAPRTVIISDRLWRTRFGGSSIDALSLRSNDSVYQVIGVMPAGFDYPAGSDYWFPRELSAPNTSRTSHNWYVVGRVADDATLERANAELSAISRALKQQYGDGTWMSDAVAVPLRDQLTATARPTLLLLFGASVVLLIIACLNVSNLQLARASTRRRELAVRLAVGAGRGRIARQLLAEAVVLSLAGTVAGVAVAVTGVRVLLALQPRNLPRIDNVSVDLNALLFAAGIAAAAAVTLGVATALRAARHDVRASLSEGTRTMAGGATTERVRQGLVIAQVALTIVLLAGAGLLTRSFVSVMSIDPGYQTNKGLLLDLQWAYSADPAVNARRRQAQEQLLTRIATVPGVESVGLISAHPLGAPNYPNGLFTEMTRIDEIATQDDVRRLFSDPQRMAEIKSRQGFAGYRIASEGYFTTMGIRLLQGRLFNESDGPDTPHVAVISESLAATQWPNQNPLGRFIQFGNMDGDLRAFRIVGVVSDVREVSLESAPGAILYGYYKQRAMWRFTFIARSTLGTALVPTLRQIIRDTDSTLPLQARTSEDALDRALAGRRFSLSLIGTFSSIALVLATLGIYGLIAYLVAERTREIGIRLALGAETRDVLRFVVGKGLMLAIAGILVGTVASLWLSRFLEGMLFGVSATDPLAFASVIGLTLVAVLAACFVPAHRATKVAPVIAMRSE